MSELIPIWYDDSIVYMRLLSREEAGELIDNPYDLTVDDCVTLVTEASEKPEMNEDMVREMDVETLTRFCKNILPDPGMQV